ncbi:MAG: hypothetical protein OJF52_003924 [Nitrospira sp.]|nr:MAG: hypothetical protein OJF52_003924 [Nitrospira sp.]
MRPDHRSWMACGAVAVGRIDHEVNRADGRLCRATVQL